jgi:INO80 complex subunit C
MAPITASSNEENHQALLDKLDLFGVPKPFRNPNWKAPQRRNKTVKQIISEASRREAASMLATQNNSGSSTPLVPASENGGGSGAHTPVGVPAGNIAQRLDRLVLERNQFAATNAANSTMPTVTGGTPGLLTPGGGQATAPVGVGTMSITYTNIESAPSMRMASKKHYCDVTGLHAPYTDPKTRLRYHDMEIFALIRSLGQGSTEGYLAARGAHTVLK